MNQLIDPYVENFFKKTDSSNITTIKQFALVHEYEDFIHEKGVENSRLQRITIKKPAFEKFLKYCQPINLVDLEYVSPYRFLAAHWLNLACHNQLQEVVNNIVNDRKTGAFLLQVDGFEYDIEKDANPFVKLATGISFLFGKANLDSMSGLFYARFVVEQKDNSDSYLRKFDNRMTLHNDGTFVNELTDYVLMMKCAEKNVQGGHSLLLHLDDWEDLESFYNHPLSGHSFKFMSPPSKNIGYEVFHPIFHSDHQGEPCLSYIDQFIKPQTTAEGLYTCALSQSLESSSAVIGFPVPVGTMIICNNHFWLHGRDKFTSSTGLYRELMRQRGVFFDSLYHQPYPEKVIRIA